MDKRTAHMRAMLERFLPMIGQPTAASRIEVTESDAGVFDIEFDGLAIACGYPVLVKSILGERAVPGYRVYWWKTYAGTRWIPDDVEDITECETLRADKALSAIGTLYAREAAVSAVLSFNPDY